MKKTKSRILACLLALVMCASSLSVTAFASGGDYYDSELPPPETTEATEPVETEAEETEVKQTGTVTTNGGKLNVRTGAGMDNIAFAQLPNGTQVEVIGEEGDWIKILLPERVGYVYSKYLTVTETVVESTDEDSLSITFNEEDLAMLLALFMGGFTGDDTTADTSEPALTPDGNLTLIDDIGTTTQSGKQFITVETKSGNVFYLIIDRDDEGEETVHFLNQVDEADLLALMDEESVPATCSCTDKCAAGAVNTSCPICAVNMTECMGKEPTPAVTEEPTAEPTEPVVEPDEQNGMGGIVVFLLIAAAGGGAAFYFLKVKKNKPKTKGSADLDDYDYGEDDEYEFEQYDPDAEEMEETDA